MQALLVSGLQVVKVHSHQGRHQTKGHQGHRQQRCQQHPITNTWHDPHGNPLGIGKGLNRSFLPGAGQRAGG
jgi:hypothetical protein